MNSEFNQYITFLNHTLGIQNIVLSSAENASMTNFAPKKYFIYVENLQFYNAEEVSLLEKMVSALKLDASEMSLLDLSQKNENSFENISKNYPATLRIILRDQPQQSGETFSPKVLLAQPDLKRKTWEDLKLAFQIKS